MSTDHLQYALENQADTIARYAADHGFHIVKTYSDTAKSGPRLKNRNGLEQLLKDVVEMRRGLSGCPRLDVSRWGHFQDNDEAAHYEYISRSREQSSH